MTIHSYSHWTKSRRSDAGGNCVECAVSEDGTMIAFRNSRHPDGPILEFDRASIQGFVADIRHGEFDFLLTPVGRTPARAV